MVGPERCPCNSAHPDQTLRNDNSKKEFSWNGIFTKPGKYQKHIQYQRNISTRTGSRKSDCTPTGASAGAFW